MSHLFFIDESGQDRKQMPYEIHGGILVPLSKSWSLIRAVKDAQIRLFGGEWANFHLEIKGEKLLQKRIFLHADGKNKKNPSVPPPEFTDDEDRRSAALSFLSKGFQEHRAKVQGSSLSIPRKAREFRAYGLACLELVDAIFEACREHNVIVFAAAVDIEAPRPPAPSWEEMLRRDLVFLFQRVYYFMENHPAGNMAVCVFDQLDDFSQPRCIEGQRLNESMARYFTRSHTGRIRSSRILPEPLYARSNLTTLMGIADVAIYIINHAYRPALRWSQPIREELRPYIQWIKRLRWNGKREDGHSAASIFLLKDLRPGEGGA